MDSTLKSQAEVNESQGLRPERKSLISTGITSNDVQQENGRDEEVTTTATDDSLTRTSPERKSLLPAGNSIAKSVLQLDHFAFVPFEEDYNAPQRSLWGAFGSVIAMSLILYFVVVSLVRFSKNDTDVSVKRRARLDSDLIEMMNVGLLIFVDRKPFHDERFFTIKYTLRAIFDGDLNNDVRPRVYVTTPSISCPVYKAPGKNAAYGCPDMEAFQEALSAKKKASSSLSSEEGDAIAPANDPADLPSAPVLQGQYGNDAYWFMEVKVMRCDENNGFVTCANETEVEKLIDSGVNVDFVMLSEISRKENEWKNIYMNLNPNVWTGVETFFRMTLSYKTDRLYRKISKDPVIFSSYKYVIMRSDNARRDNFMTFFLRLDSEVVEETNIRYSFLDVFNDIGGTVEFILITIGLLFVYGNQYLYYKKKNTDTENQNEC